MKLAEFDYELGRVEKGYSNRTLHVDLTNMKISAKPVSAKMKDIFIGGRGFDLWLLWKALPKGRIVKWDDPENEICIACGPLGGLTSAVTIIIQHRIIRKIRHNVIDQHDRTGAFFADAIDQRHRIWAGKEDAIQIMRESRRKLDRQRMVAL